MIYLLIFLIGALAYRIRGGLLKDKFPWVTTCIGRAVWALAFAGVFSFTTQQWLFAPAVLIFAYIGTLHGYFEGQFDLLLPENRNIKNYIHLTGSSLLRFLPMFLIFILTPYSIGFACALAASGGFVLYYLAGCYISRYSKLQGASQFGEIITGGCVLLAFYLGLQ